MATSKEFQEKLKAGDFLEAFRLALSEVVHLNITTTVFTEETPGNPLPQPGSRMRTVINIVDGDIETEIGSRFLNDGPYGELRDFHTRQVMEGRQIIRANIESIQSLLQACLQMSGHAALPSAPAPAPSAPGASPFMDGMRGTSDMSDGVVAAPPVDVVVAPEPIVAVSVAEFAAVDVPGQDDLDLGELPFSSGQPDLGFSFEPPVEPAVESEDDRTAAASFGSADFGAMDLDAPDLGVADLGVADLPLEGLGMSAPDDDAGFPPDLGIGTEETPGESFPELLSPEEPLNLGEIDLGEAVVPSLAEADSLDLGDPIALEPLASQPVGNADGGLVEADAPDVGITDVGIDVGIDVRDPDAFTDAGTTDAIDVGIDVGAIDAVASDAGLTDTVASDAFTDLFPDDDPVADLVYRPEPGAPPPVVPDVADQFVDQPVAFEDDLQDLIFEAVPAKIAVGLDREAIPAPDIPNPLGYIQAQLAQQSTPPADPQALAESLAVVQAALDMEPAPLTPGGGLPSQSQNPGETVVDPFFLEADSLAIVDRALSDDFLLPPPSAPTLSPAPSPAPELEAMGELEVSEDNFVEEFVDEFVEEEEPDPIDSLLADSNALDNSLGALEFDIPADVPDLLADLELPHTDIPNLGEEGASPSDAAPPPSDPLDLAAFGDSDSDPWASPLEEPSPSAEPALESAPAPEPHLDFPSADLNPTIDLGQEMVSTVERTVERIPESPLDDPWESSPSLDPDLEDLEGSEGSAPAATFGDDLSFLHEEEAEDPLDLLFEEEATFGEAASFGESAIAGLREEDLEANLTAVFEEDLDEAAPPEAELLANLDAELQDPESQGFLSDDFTEDLEPTLENDLGLDLGDNGNGDFGNQLDPSLETNLALNEALNEVLQDDLESSLDPDLDFSEDFSDATGFGLGEDLEEDLEDNLGADLEISLGEDLEVNLEDDLDLGEDLSSSPSLEDSLAVLEDVDDFDSDSWDAAPAGTPLTPPTPPTPGSTPNLGLSVLQGLDAAEEAEVDRGPSLGPDTTDPLADLFGNTSIEDFGELRRESHENDFLMEDMSASESSSDDPFGEDPFALDDLEDDDPFSSLMDDDRPLPPPPPPRRPQ